jgi:hypothetical protein
MLRGIYKPDELPPIFGAMEPALKIKTKYLNELTISKVADDYTDRNGEYRMSTTLVVKFKLLKTEYSAEYKIYEVLNNEEFQGVVPLILVLQDFTDKLYLAVTYIKWLPNEVAIINGKKH